jgi:hypothetical protein
MRILILVVFCFLSSSASAKLISPVITPIVIDQPGQSTGIDIDLDGETDLSFFYDVYLDSAFMHINIEPSKQATNKVVVTGEQNNFGKDLVAALMQGATISSASEFNGPIFGNGPLLAQPEFGGSDILEGKGDVYIGFSFIRDGQTHYAWLLLNVSAAGDRVTILRYGWEDVPGAPVFAGALPEMSVRGDVEGKCTNEGAVVDLLGRVVLQTGSERELTSLRSGVYFIRRGSKLDKIVVR